MSTPAKAILVLAVCGWMLWKMVDQWLTPVVEPGRVTTLTSDNFAEVRKEAKTLIALYMRPGCRSCGSTISMLGPMAHNVKGRAIIAVCDLNENPDVGRRERAETGTMIIYRDGQEVARTVPGGSNPAFVTEMQMLGVGFVR